MKKFAVILLMLALPALAAWKEYTNAEAGFRASFPDKPTYSRDGQMVMYTSGDFTVALLPRAWAKSRYGLLKDFTTDGPAWAKGNLAKTEREVDGRPGLELSGVSQQGGPVLVHLVATPNGGYAVIGRSYDMKENTQFVSSFRFVPIPAKAPAPAPKAK